MARSFPVIVEQHAEEAAFLWILRNGAIRAPNHNLESLAGLDERIDAHLDGLRIAGAHGWDECRRQLEWRETGEVFAAAYMALRSRIGRRLDLVLEVVGSSVELARGVIGALAWLPYSDVDETIGGFLRSDDAVMRCIGLAASAAHRRDPGHALASAMIDSDPILRGRAVKAAAELGRRDLLPLCVDASESISPDERFWNGWSAALLGDRQSAGILRRTAVACGPLAERACDLATRRMSPGEALNWHRDLSQPNGNARLAIVVTRALGDPTLMPWLLDAMRCEELARLAGEAFTFITGVELPRAGLAAMRPDGFASRPTDDPSDDDVAMDPDEHLPWPYPGAVARWWSANHLSFVGGNRYLMGRPITPENLHAILSRGGQRQRAAAALELVHFQPGQPLFEVRARADVQMRALTASTRIALSA